MTVDIKRVRTVSQRMQWASVVPGASLLMLLTASILAFVLGTPAGTLANNTVSKQFADPKNVIADPAGDGHLTVVSNERAGKFTPKADAISFMSPNRKVACIIESDGRGSSDLRANCNGLKSLRKNSFAVSGWMTRNGRVRICRVARPSLKRSCFVNFYRAPTLPYGQWLEYAGVRCTSAHNGITCIKLTKPRKGHGFRVSNDEAVRVKRNLGPGRLTIPTTAHSAFFKPSCNLSTRCSARVTVKGVGKILARGAYSIPAHSSRKVAIVLTKAGRAALAGKNRVGAKLTIIDTRTGKRKSIQVVLKR